MIQSALQDLLVLDFTHYIAGPFAAKLLADYGANVVKIERPGGGDGARKLGPFPGDKPHPEKSGIFLHLNTNKKSAVIDLKKPEGAAIARRIARRADIIVENFRPGVMASLGLGYEDLSRTNPGLVMVSITDFGQWGPYRDYKGSEIVDYALGGAYFVSGLPERNPLKLGGNAVQYLAGAHGAAAAAVAIVGRMVRGHGDWIDLSIMETQAGSPDRRTPMLVGYQYTGETNKRGGGAAPPVRPCKDGYINMGIALYWMDRVAAMLGRPEIAKDPRFTDPAQYKEPENAEAFEAIYLEWLSQRTMAEAWEAGQKHRVLSGPIYSVADVMKDRNFRERGYWERIEHPVAGAYEYPGLPFKTFSGAPERQPRRPAPRLGEHTDEVLRAFGYGPRQIARLRREGAVA